jgi:class 3 adenylate cyclase
MQTETLSRENVNPQPASTRAASGRGCVLVVDDEEPNRILLRDPLEMHGYQVLEAEDGERALQEVAQCTPDVILLDVMMPGLDGFEVCRRLKQDVRTAPIPVLMVTALSERKERMMGIAAGANDFLNKPVDIHDLTLRVRNAVYTKQLFDQLQAEQQKSEQLLLNILPKAVAERMRSGEVNIADSCPEAMVLVADLVGFSTLAAHVGAEQVVYLLNEIFSAFDLLVEKHGLEKIKTIGDAYMVAGGVPLPRPDHAVAMARLALSMRTEIEQFNRQYETSIQMRTGMSAGPVVAGVIGRKKFAYDLWGDTVNVAFRLGALAETGTIQVAEPAYERLKSKCRFEGKQVMDIKGKGEVTTYRLCGLS